MQKADILQLLLSTPLEELKEKAAQLVIHNKGCHVYCRGLIEFSNICNRNCLYCGLRGANHKLERYCMTQEEIISTAKIASAQGVDSIVLQSGESAVRAEWLAEVIEEIVNTVHLPVVLGVGECKEGDYVLWRKAGASRYLLKHETANEALYSRLHPGYCLKTRINALKVLASLDYEIGSGFIIDLPGSTLESYADDILLCKKLNVKMCGIGPFIPQNDTPLSTVKAGGVSNTLRILSALRIVLPQANLPATTALATVSPENGQVSALEAGANVLMPSFTPPERAKFYRIYDAKNSISIENAMNVVEKAKRTCNLKQSVEIK